MATAQDYGVGFGFKGQDGVYYGPRGSIGMYHLGNDYFTPMNTPLVLSGVQLGLTGNTGIVGGAHVHVAKYLNGNTGGYYIPTYNKSYYDPSDVWAQTGTVIERGKDTAAGNFVRIKADNGFIYEFFHLNRIDVQVGQLIAGGKGGGETEVKIGADNAWYERMNRLHHQLVRNGDLPREVFNAIIGQDAWQITESWSDHNESNQLIKWQEIGQLADRDKWDQQIFGLQKQITELRKKVEEFEKSGDKEALAKVRKDLIACEAKFVDLQKENDEADKTGNALIRFLGNLFGKK